MSNKEKEKDRIERFSVNALRIKGVSEIRVTDATLTPRDLVNDRAKWAGYTLLPGLREKNFEKSDEELIRELLYKGVPVEIIGETENRTGAILKIQFQRFPYSIDGKRAFQSFGMRIFPESGKINQVTLNDRRTIAINRQSFKSTEGLTVDLGNGMLHLEILFNKPTEELPPLEPPVGFQETATTTS